MLFTCNSSSEKKEEKKEVKNSEVLTLQQTLRVDTAYPWGIVA
jgi:hypothetical protein